MNIDDLINDLMVHRNTDMLDKTKCSVTAKNVYNYIVSKYSTNNDTISWNDTIINGSTLNEFVAYQNTVYYFYYDHITGETSHYFIILILDGIVHVFQSAVFEYSIAEWLGKYEEPIIQFVEDFDDERNYFANLANQVNVKLKNETLERIKNSNKVLQIDDLITAFKQLEGDWSNTCKEKCEIFTDLFACKMDYQRYEKLFKQETKSAQFRFVFTHLKL